jgi:hypothetical protein
MGFFNLTNYPPDLTFLLLRTGIDLLLLRLWMWLESVRPSGVRHHKSKSSIKVP